MDWLKAVSQLVAKEGQPMSWITPLGLPVLQPYRRTDTYQVWMRQGNIYGTGRQYRNAGRAAFVRYSAAGSTAEAAAVNWRKSAEGCNRKLLIRLPIFFFCLCRSF